MEKIQASACILTFNSGKTLRRALDSARDFDEIVLCDGGSTDDTLALAKEYGCRIIPQDAKYKNSDNTLKDIGGLRNQCVDAATHDWVLILDSDESISEGLCEEIRLAVRKIEPLVYRMPMRMFIGAQEISYSSNYPGYQYRFFNRKSGARFVRPVHNRVEFPPQPIGTFKNPWYVFWDEKDVSEYNERAFKYIKSEVDAITGLTPWSFFSYFIPRHLRIIIAVVAKALRDRILHPFSPYIMPLKIEFGRVRYQLRLIGEAGRKLFRKTA